MEFTIPQKPEKKRRFSLWQHLRGLAGKNKPEKAVASTDVTLVAASKLYNSFRHNTNKNAMLEVSSAANDGPEAYTTLEDSALQNVHRDAGILFLTSNTQLKWKNPDGEQEKHVQFAPTPYNKYHTYSSDPRKGKRFGKENSRPALEINTMRPPVLKHPMDTENAREDSGMMVHSKHQRTFQEINSNTSIDKEMTSLLPRTSTKSVLGQADSTLPYFNESTIFQVHQNSLNSSRYNSLRRTNQKHYEKSIILQENMCSFPNVEPYENDSREISKDTGKKVKHYFTDDVLETSKSNLQISSGKTDNELHHSTTFQGKCMKGDLKGHDDRSWIINHSKPAMETLPYFTVSNLENPQILTANMKANLRRHSFHQHQMQRVDYNNFTMNNHEDVNDPLSHIPSQHAILKKAPVPEPPGTISVGKPISINRNVTQLNDPLIPPFVSLPTTNQKVIFPVHPSKNDLKISCRRRNDPNFLNYLRNRELPLVPENSRIEDCITRHTKVGRGLRSSSPDLASYKNCRRKQKSKYDGVSSMADDECSLNCSCGDCLTDLKHASKEVRRSYRRGNVRAKLFFPSDKCEDCLIPGSEFRIPPTTRMPINNVKILEQPVEEWYTCSDIMCKSPKANHIVENSTKTRGCQENIYANSDVFIADDYEVNGNCQTKDNKTILQVQNEHTLPLNNKFRGIAKKNNTPDASIAESVAHLQVQDGIELTPRTKKLSQTCISALSGTLTNLLQNYKDQPNPSFSISSFNSGDESSEKLNTIVIKIQKDDQQKNAEQKPPLPIDDHWSISQKLNRCSTMLSRSLPELFKECKLHKESKDEMVFKSTMALSPATKNPMKKRESVIPNDETRNLTINEGLIEYNEEFPSGWDKSPSAVDTNSGYSTCSLISSKNSNISLSSADRELLNNVIKAGMGIQQTPGSKKKFLGTPKIFKVGKFKAKEVLSGKAKLKLSIYYNAGLATIHIMKAVKLTSVRSLQLNPYVKVSLHPDDSRRVHWRSKVTQSQNSPVFNQKFSFEITPGDSKKRLIFSLWHRDLGKKRSEFLGCMSFGVHRILDSTQKINGWYRLLKEVVGTKKHFAASHGKVNAVIKMLEG